LRLIGGWRHAHDVKPDLRAELLRRAERDQAARGAPEPDWDVVASVDAGNLGWLKQVVSEVGWPGTSMVGEDGAHAAWLLAQHADSDPQFQRRCLGLLAQAAAYGEALPAELAYLTDRVLLAEGTAQEYGTQFESREGRWVPQWLRDPGTVDERRAAMGLGTLAENTARIAAEYGMPKPASITCPRCAGSIEVWPLADGETRQIRCAACSWTATVTAPSAPDLAEDAAGD
jgi:hypothetical protein